MTEASPRWEHCQLVLIGATMPQPRTATLGAAPIPAETHYHVEVVYMGPEGAYVERQLADFEQTLAYNPFYRVIGLLGGAGWELVSVGMDQHYAWDDAFGRVVVPYQAGLRPISRSAYFKRQVVTGSPVDDPQLML
jgi:hypothetical protein